SLRFACEALGILRRYDAIEPAIYDEKRAGNVLRDAFQRKRCSMLARFVLRLAVAAHAERFARELRQAIPGRAPVDRPTERDTGLDALVAGRRARRIVTA